jgi:hypothetical protein
MCFGDVLAEKQPTQNVLHDTIEWSEAVVKTIPRRIATGQAFWIYERGNAIFHGKALSVFAKIAAFSTLQLPAILRIADDGIK